MAIWKGTSMERGLILQSRIRKRESIQGKITIGVIGTHLGAGSTHFSILICNYLSECLGKRTALIECYPQNELQYFEDGYFIRKKELIEDNAFSINRVTYYKSMKEKEIGEVIGSGYDCVVLDLGIDFLKKKSEFQRCDRRIILSSLSPWKKNDLKRFLNGTDHIKNNHEWLYGIPFVSKKEIKETSKEFCIPMFRVPCEPDPFTLSTDTIKMFQKII